jgi:serine/threonine-protein kinase
VTVTDAAPAAARGGAEPRAAGERRGLGLGTRIFLITALLIVLAVGGAVAYTAFTAGRIARDQAAEALRASHEVFTTSRTEREGALLRDASIFASDPGVAIYLAEAIPAGDRASILDQLGERRADFEFDFAAVLDPDGRLVARTDRPAGGGEELEESDLVAQALEEYVAVGLWRDGDALYEATVVPLDPGGLLAGFLVTGFDLGLDRVMGNDVAAVIESGGAPAIAASTLGLDRERLLASALRARPGPYRRAVEEGETVGGVELDLDGEPWIALFAPLADAGGDPVGASAVLVSLDRELAPFRAIQRALLAAGLAAVLLAFALSFGFARRVLAPIRRLGAAAAAARDGDYDQEIPTGRGDEVGSLARAFDHLLSDLREKRDMEAYVAELSRTLPDAGAAQPLEPTVRPAVRERLALLGAEFRDRARLGSGEPGEVIEGLGRDLRRLRELAVARGGRVEAVAGHRAWVSFRGSARCQRALATAADLLAAGGRSLNAPAVAIAEGPAEAGTVGENGSARPALAGPPVQQLESLVREAGPGDIVLDRRVHDELAEAFARSGLPLVERRGVITPQPLYVVRPDEAAQVTSDLAAPTPMTAGGPRRGDRETLSQIRPGSVVGGRFEILSLLGMGGMGMVFKARDRELDDLVALKMLRADRGVGAEEVERLKEELKLARRITHPNVLRTYDLGMVDGTPFISMEYVRGVTLRYLLDQTDRLPYSAGLRLSRQLCHGLAAAHAVGVVHRDIKPENLILEPNGNAKLMDFGIARLLRRPDPDRTPEGMVVGTPHYLAPEQLRGEEATPRSDIYSAGVVLYELFTGELPFRAHSAREAVMAAIEQEPTPPSTYWPEIPGDLERALLTCLEKDPDRRFAGAPDLLRRLDALRA